MNRYLFVSLLLSLFNLSGCEEVSPANSSAIIAKGEESNERAENVPEPDPATARVSMSSWPEGCVDEDWDGYPACPEPVDFAVDCDDGLNSIHPRGVEMCNGVDDDCDGQIDEALSHCEGGAPSPGPTDPDPRAENVPEPDPATARVSMSSWPEGCVDADWDGYPICPEPVGFAMDCDDGTNSIHPRGVEMCNGVDDDCDGQIDEALSHCEGGLPQNGLPDDFQREG